MRIACTNHHRQLVGGTESYLKQILPEFERLGHEVSFWHEGSLASGAPFVDASEVFRVSADSPAALSQWKPDVIFNNGLMNMEWEASLPGIAPVVHFAHNYYGTCISGEKTRKAPTPCACDRQFGWPCLVQYFPRRCGGLNPSTMWHDYLLQSSRLNHLRNCSAVVTASRYIEAEYRNHGISKLFRAPLFVRSTPMHSTASPVSGRAPKILFCGRMMFLKGGDLLLDALPLVERALARPVEATFAGDGPQRAAWERRATKVKFTGWLGQEELHQLAALHDLTVMPSIWPEPFGLTGLELGIPVVAFAVGGIPDWLENGTNGQLAPADPPTAAGLASAIIECLSDPARLAALKRGAVEAAGRFTLQRHLDALLPVFESVR